MKQTKLYLLSGFLGAGKTSFLKKMLDRQKDKKIGIIMNEFGRISIDGPILDTQDIQMTELTRGSIFCSCLKLSFIDALIQMADKDLDYVFVESSGLADPSNIGEFLSLVSTKVAHPYAYSGAICIVDGVHFLNQYNELETIVRQIKCADLVIISKIDLIDRNTVTGIKNAIIGINPQCRVLESDHYDIDFSFIGYALNNGAVPAPIDSLNTEENKPKTLVLTYDAPVEEAALNAFLEALAPSAYRIKGFVELDTGLKQVDVVGERIDMVPADFKFEQSTLVVISKIGVQIIRPLDSAWQSLCRVPMKLSN